MNLSHFDPAGSSMPARRTFLRQTGYGLGGAALASLLTADTASAAPAGSNERWCGVVNPLHVVPRAKRVVFLCMAGGPSQHETLDHKSKLVEMDGEPMPKRLTSGQQIAQLQGAALRCLAPQHPFRRWGRSGQQISSILPHIGSIADDICIIRSMQTDQINHDPAHTFMNTGTALAGHPSIGSWLLYGLGAETEQLPGFVVLTSVGGGQTQPIAARQWHSGFLPGRFQGVHMRSTGDPVLYLKRPPGVSEAQQRDVIDASNAFNRIGDKRLRDPEIETRISQYEMAFRMQASVPELTDVSDEPKHIFDMYGANPGDGTFASNCLLARRLLERGVRFVQLYHRGWDHHSGVKNGTAHTARLCDQASAALVRDLKQRGMLDDTLVIWGGEFGRTPMAQGNGRDHHIKAFSIWLAGTGIKPGMTYGATDEYGYNAIENRVHVRDLHATILHLCGIDHERLTVKFKGLDQRLTGVESSFVVNDIIA